MREEKKWKRRKRAKEIRDDDEHEASLGSAVKKKKVKLEDEEMDGGDGMGKKTDQHLEQIFKQRQMDCIHLARCDIPMSLNPRSSRAKSKRPPNSSSNGTAVVSWEILQDDLTLSHLVRSS